MAIYALDFWEHTLGLAFDAVGDRRRCVDVLDGTRGGAGPRLGAGALFGVAATMRTEALVYFAVTTLVVLAALLVTARHSLPATWRRCLAPRSAPLPRCSLANHLLEIAS